MGGLGLHFLEQMAVRGYGVLQWLVKWNLLLVFSFLCCDHFQNWISRL